MKDQLKLMMAQTCSGNTHQSNIEVLEKLAESAANNHCDMLCLPEASGLLNQDVEHAKTMLTTDINDPYVKACRLFAKEYGIWIHNGSTPVFADKDLPVNRTHLVNSEGEIVARYDKIHLFDVHLPDGKNRLESSRYAPGETACVTDTPWGPMGLSICYDLRFPQLYRNYARRGARIMFIPSAFNRRTGAAHWEVLLRARAIENGCFIVAAAQTGVHADGRKTYGHSMIVHPWGNVLTDLNTEIQTCFIDLDLSESNQAREQIPSLQNERGNFYQ